MSTIKSEFRENKKSSCFWRFNRFFEPVAEQFQIGRDEILTTPLEKIDLLFIKREDLSPTGSHKFRSLVYQLSRLSASGQKNAILSSSGNAAIAASRYAASAKIQVFVFLSEKTPQNKLAALTMKNIVPILSNRPLRLAKYASAHFKLPNLCPSRDSNATIGFRSLGLEIFEQTQTNGAVANIFSFVTSGASLLGIFDSYQKLIEHGKLNKIPKLFGVTASGNLAGNLSGKREKIAKNIEKICDKSGGAVVKISDEQILSTGQYLKKNGILTSNEGVASFAAAKNVNPAGKTVVIFTGKKWDTMSIDSTKFLHAKNFADVDKILKDNGV